jgi:VWFA-related protein
MLQNPVMRSTTRVLSVTIALLTLTGALRAQAPPAVEAPRITFGVEVGYVEIDAIVTDRDGKPVLDLKREEFVVHEDGKPQNIDLFTRIDLPFERLEQEAPQALTPDVESNERPFAGRLYVLVLDGLHTHALRTPLVRAAARRFLERHLAEGDLAAVVHTSGGDDRGQGLTGNRRQLLASVERFTGQKLPSVTLNRTQEYRRTQDYRSRDERVGDPDAMKRGHDARSFLDTLKNVVDFLANIHGRRKAVIVLSEGLDYDLHDPFNNRDASSLLDSMRTTTAAAAGANVSFYTVDPRGLGGLSSESMEIQPVFDDPSLGLNEQGLAADFRRSQETLQVLAEETSGRAAVNTNDFEGAFARIVKDNSAYYMLGYHPANPKRDGRAHKLQVKVSRPGLEVRARSSYKAPRGKPTELDTIWARRGTPAPLVGLLQSPLANSGLPLTVQATSFRGAEGRARVMVAVQVAAQSFRFTEKDGVFHDVLEISSIAVDASGKVFGADQTIKLDLKPQTRELVDAAGFRFLSWLDLVPGRYQVRVAARSVNRDAAGSVFYDLEVPELGKEKLALSGIVLTSLVARHVPTAGSTEILKDVLPGPPTTWRAFHPKDSLALATEIYDDEKAAHTLDVLTSLTAADGSVAFRTADERQVPAAVKGEKPAVLHTAQIPLQALAPGVYTLRVEAASRMGKNPARAQRELKLQVLPANAS